jgi:hypothetical protein
LDCTAAEAEDIFQNGSPYERDVPEDDSGFLFGGGNVRGASSGTRGWSREDSRGWGEPKRWAPDDPQTEVRAAAGRASLGSERLDQGEGDEEKDHAGALQTRDRGDDHEKNRKKSIVSANRNRNRKRKRNVSAKSRPETVRSPRRVAAAAPEEPRMARQKLPRKKFAQATLAFG